jgi:hypothetical protein
MLSPARSSSATGSLRLPEPAGPGPAEPCPWQPRPPRQGAAAWPSHSRAGHRNGRRNQGHEECPLLCWCRVCREPTRWRGCTEQDVGRLACSVARAASSVQRGACSIAHVGKTEGSRCRLQFTVQWGHVARCHASTADVCARGCSTLQPSDYVKSGGATYASYHLGGFCSS